jgi:hypothetical protein
MSGRDDDRDGRHVGRESSNRSERDLCASEEEEDISGDRDSHRSDVIAGQYDEEDHDSEVEDEVVVAEVEVEEEEVEEEEDEGMVSIDCGDETSSSHGEQGAKWWWQQWQRKLRSEAHKIVGALGVFTVALYERGRRVANRHRGGA